MSSEESSKIEETEVVYVAPSLSSEEQPMDAWSSIEVMYLAQTTNPKKKLYEQGLYDPGSPDVCNKYIPISDSAIYRHAYYNYPAVLNPGIEKALLGPEPTFIYPEDGQQLYLDLCAEMDICPVGLFYRNLKRASIDLSFYGVNPKGIRAMALALENNPNVTRFDLTDNVLTDDGCYHLGNMLKSNVTIQELNLSGCCIGESGLNHIGDNLYLNNTLLTLNLASNKLGDEGGVAFAKLMRAGLGMRKVNLSRNFLGQNTCIALMENLENNITITSLDLSWNNFTHVASAVKMIEQLAKCSVLEELYLNFNAFDGDRLANAIKMLLKIPNLRILDLSNNRLQGAPLSEITNYLIYARKLSVFNISFNPLTPDDAFVTLSRMLKPRVKVQQLLMEGVCVLPTFLELLTKVKMMKSRKVFKVTHSEVLHNWTVSGPNPRIIVLNRAIYLGNANKKKIVDVALYLLVLGKEITKPISVKELLQRVEYDKVPLNEKLIEELGVAFPGPKGKIPSVNLVLICDYVRRMCPETKLPPTPRPDAEGLDPSELLPEPVAPPPPSKEKKGKK